MKVYLVFSNYAEDEDNEFIEVFANKGAAQKYIDIQHFGDSDLFIEERELLN